MLTHSLSLTSIMFFFHLFLWLQWICGCIQGTEQLNCWCLVFHAVLISGILTTQLMKNAVFLKADHTANNLKFYIKCKCNHFQIIPKPCRAHTIFCFVFVCLLVLIFNNSFANVVQESCAIPWILYVLCERSITGLAGAFWILDQVLGIDPAPPATPLCTLIRLLYIDMCSKFTRHFIWFI